MQHVARTRFEIARRYQPVKHRQQGALLQRRLAPAAHELQCLGDELDLADATGTEFDVGPHTLARDLALDERFHRAQRLKRAVIEILAKHEWLEAREQPLAGNTVAGGDARLDEGVTLPLAPVHLVVVFHGVERHRQRSAGAVRAQAHVHPEHKPVGGGLAQCLHQFLAEMQKLFVTAIVVAGVGEDQIHVRGEIKFAPAELAHAEHDETRRRLEPGRERHQCAFEAGVGQIRKRRHHFVQVGPAGKVAKGDTHHFALAYTAQTDLESSLVHHAGERAADPHCQFAGGVGAREVAARQQFTQQFGFAHAAARDEIARGQHARQHLEPRAIGRDL